MAKRRAGGCGPFLVACALLGGAGCSSSAPEPTSGPEPTVLVYAGERWFEESPEPESVWAGRLERNEQIIGPATRGGLNFALTTDAERLLIYSEGVDRLLAPLVGRQVELRGKLINMPFGPEIWPASMVGQ